MERRTLELSWSNLVCYKWIVLYFSTWFNSSFTMLQIKVSKFMIHLIYDLVFFSNAYTQLYTQIQELHAQNEKCLASLAKWSTAFKISQTHLKSKHAKCCVLHRELCVVFCKKSSQRLRISVWFCRFGVCFCCLSASFQKLCDKKRKTVIKNSSKKKNHAEKILPGRKTEMESISCSSSDF